MSFSDVEGLIELVKPNVFLYDVFHRKYKDASLKATVWEAIADKLNTSSDVVKHKWKTIRDGYIKYKKQLKNSEESGKNVIEYIWSTNLAFLDNYGKHGRGNVNYNYALQPQVQLFEESSERMSPIPSQWVGDSLDEPAAKRKKSVDQTDVDQIINLLTSSKTKHNDAIDHLFMSYAETFKKFSPRRQAQMKIQLAKLFSNAELKELQSIDDSQPGSSTSPTDFLYSNIKAENVV